MAMERINLSHPNDRFPIIVEEATTSPPGDAPPSEIALKSTLDSWGRALISPIGAMILPSTLRRSCDGFYDGSEQHINSALRWAWLPYRVYHGKSIFTPTNILLPETLSLSCIAITNSSNKHRNWMVYLLPNAEIWEVLLPLFKKISEIMEINILVGNPRGVGRSTGTASSATDLIQDGELLLQSLLQRGVTKVVMSGLSLGGALAVQVAARYQNHPKCIIGCIAHNTFARLSKLPSERLSPRGASTPLLSVLSSTAEGALSGTWELNTIEAWEKIDQARKLVFHPEKDPVIPLSASLYEAVTDKSNKVLLPLSEEHMRHPIQGSAKRTIPFTRYSAFLQNFFP